MSSTEVGKEDAWNLPSLLPLKVRCRQAVCEVCRPWECSAGSLPVRGWARTDVVYQSKREKGDSIIADNERQASLSAIKRDEEGEAWGTVHGVHGRGAAGTPGTVPHGATVEMGRQGGGDFLR